jgi:protein gp37
VGETTKIEWATATFNPWIGCTKVSPACANCYAERYGNRFDVAWGPGKARRRTSASNWRQPLVWNRAAEKARKFWAQCGAVGSPPPRPRVFCASLADWLDDEVPAEWLADLLALVAATPELDWLLLSKRPGSWRDRLAEVAELFEHENTYRSDLVHMVWDWQSQKPPANVWLGTTVEDQRRADERIPRLLEIPARVRFLSCEPLLGPLDLRQWLEPPHGVCGPCDAGYPTTCTCPDDLHWIIAGGESGAGARPSHPDWIRGLRDQAQAAGVPFLFKQWGEHAPAASGGRLGPEPVWVDLDGKVTSDRCPVPPTQGSAPMQRVGKVTAGRELDGRTWDVVPRG